tara:strand:- start:18 stop:800 length:783 start_codon:yes stop_codon:yes gene_type:complete
MEIVNQLLGWFIILGGLGSYMLQYIKLCKHKHTDGINDKMLMLGNLSCVLNVLSSIIYNYHILYNSTGVVLYYALFPIFELITPLLYLEINYILYIFYSKKYKDRIVFVIYHIFALFFSILSIGITFAIYSSNNSQYNNGIALILNIGSSIASIIMWIPQLITTCTEKAAKSLSLLSLGFHSAGCLIIVIFQLLEGQRFSIVIPYIIGFLAEGFIIIYCLYYRQRSSSINESFLNDTTDIISFVDDFSMSDDSEYTQDTI